MKILVAEDQEDLRELFRGVLAAAGYEVFGAANGSEAFKVYKIDFLGTAAVALGDCVCFNGGAALL